MALTNLTILPFESQQAWRKWLQAHYAKSPGIWLKIAKKGSGEPTVSYDEALEEALCYGWIDGQKRPLDESYWLQKFTPRRAKSVWSKRNVGKAEALIAAGHMHAAGQAEVDAAKADGRWKAAYHSQSTITVPDDLQKALLAHPKANEFFITLNGVNRYAILYRVTTVKKPETRAAKIEKFITMLEAGQKIYPDR
jgi:uncharacterized protein YdeI (YjbR/CyaY-like superfamily)